MKIDSAAIRALLTPGMVLDYFDIKRRGRVQWSVQLCPSCGQRSRGSVSIHAESGLWKCFHCEAHGGLFDLIAGYAAIDVKKDFHRVLHLAAVIAGVPHGVDDEDYVKLLEEHRARRAEQIAAEEARRARIRARMPSTWALLDRRSVAGERYLRERCLDPETLRSYDAVRYSRLGDPAVQLRDLGTGDVTGIQYRMLKGDSKLTAQPGSQSSGACLLGRVADLEKIRLAVIVEGLADTLAARLIWPDAAVFGAPGAEQLESIGTTVGSAVVRRRGVLLIVPDNDKIGDRNTARAIVAAEDAGLELVDAIYKHDEAKMQIVDLGFDLGDKRHHDLAEARMRSRWQWRWPEDGGPTSASITLMHARQESEAAR